MKFAFSARNFIASGRRPIVLAVAASAIVFYLAYHLTKFQLWLWWPPAPSGDASIQFDLARKIFAQAAYPPNDIFPYAPSAVIIFRSLSIGGPHIFMMVWSLLMAAGLIVTMRAALAQERADIQAAWLLIGAVAVVICDAPVSWDLRNANSNLVYLGLVMAGYGLLGRLPMLAGVLVGVSISLKLYSGLLLAWLFANAPRAAAAGVVTVVVLWFVLPVVLFGTDGTLTLYSGWREQVRTISDPSLHARLLANPDVGPPLVTLQRAIVNATGGTFGSPATLARLWLLWMIWGAALVWYTWRCRHAFPVAVPSRAALADWVVLLLAPLPFSPWLEPYHAIPLLVGALLCLAIALDETLARRDRIAALAALAPLLLFIVVKVPFAVRGFSLGFQFLVMVLALGYLRPGLAERRDSA